MARFTPLKRRTEGLGPNGPHEGVPDWLVHSLWEWTQEQLVAGSYVREDRLRLIELQLEIPLGGGHSDTRLEALSRKIISQRETFLEVLDFIAGQLGENDKQTASNLEVFLSLGGSAWRVAPVDGHFQLARRIDPQVQELVTQVIAPGDRASKHLEQAIAAAYGRRPNPGHAYREAVRAVEAVACSVVLPKDPSPTLGKAIKSMTDKPTKWQVVLKPSSGDPVLAVVSMMEMLWKSQFDRHGTADESVPLQVSLAEAQAALQLAAALVQMFRSGAITPR